MFFILFYFTLGVTRIFSCHKGLWDMLYFSAAWTGAVVYHWQMKVVNVKNLTAYVYVCVDELCNRWIIYLPNVFLLQFFPDWLVMDAVSLQRFCTDADFCEQETVALETQQRQSFPFSSLSQASERDCNYKYKCADSLMRLGRLQFQVKLISEDVIKCSRIICVISLCSLRLCFMFSNQSLKATCHFSLGRIQFQFMTQELTRK